MKWKQDDVPWEESIFVNSKNQTLARVSSSGHELWWWQISGHPELAGREPKRGDAEQKAEESLVMLGALPPRK